MVHKNLSPIMKSILFIAIVIISGMIAGGLALGPNNAVAAKDPTPEEIVEKTIIVYGTRAGLYGVQKNGILRSLVKFISPDGTREGKTAMKFLRKEKMSDDMRLLEIELPGTNYVIGYDGKDVWSVFNGEIRKPSPQEINPFKSSHVHGYEALLRYKENNSKLEYIGSNKFGTLELNLIDLISEDGQRTRYEISSRSYRILYLSYEDPSANGGEPVKYRLNFKDFQYIQNTLVPYVTTVFQNGTLIEERKVVEAVFNVQLEEKDFKAENNLNPSESTPGEE